MQLEKVAIENFLHSFYFFLESEQMHCLNSIFLNVLRRSMQQYQHRGLFTLVEKKVSDHRRRILVHVK